ncbi:MAG: aspartate ammonia-lyase [Fimbriimonas ginsengisoli]|uniref:aspartate ammonia-lyase n=1 Tax=Fimbriimonas ginsengisoli TaxID=1005039 RepID=A0A931PT49_FIMGI|nr:aspartate ammonia-lyase [Fimbriimonas ginsengisoli]
MDFRIEKDSLGEVRVPAGAYWGSQAERSRLLFPISGLTEHPKMIDAYILLKKSCTEANLELGLLSAEIGRAIVQAADEILSGKLRDQFPVDVFHMGAGTSLNMNCNEVLANRAEEILGGKLGEYRKVNPNDHPNFGQSTNDTFPSAMRIMARLMLAELFKAVDHLASALERKGTEFDRILKSGRTHLQDAVPIRLGQEFAAYAACVRRARRWLDYAASELEELGIGGSAVGTGLNTHPKYRFMVAERLAKATGIPFRIAPDLREAMQSNLAMGALAASLRLLCLELTRIANDLRLMCSGPLTGLAELLLPPVQPGSSIMPGKVNPSMAENLNIVLFQVLGQCQTIDYCVQAGQLELNVMMPGMAFAAQFALQILTNTLRTFTDNCVVGIRADEERCRRYAETSPSLATALNTFVGYEVAAEVVKAALAEGKTIPEVVRERGLLDEETLKKALDPALLTEPGIPGA